MGGDPGGHPGVTRVPLDGSSNDTLALEEAFDSGAKFQGFYTAGGETFAVFASGYK